MAVVCITGMSGYIGSHVAVSLLAAGHDVVGIDNCSNSYAESVDGIRAIAGRNAAFYEGDLSDASFLDGVFSRHRPNAVIHLAGKKSVPESVADPLLYYRENLSGSVVLLDAMRRHGIGRIVFSSSACVYDARVPSPWDESVPTAPVTPYGQSKLMFEQVLRESARAYGMRAIALRYFNPIGSHESGRIGERPKGTFGNIFPYMLRVHRGESDALTVYGSDYPTPDGTCVRDFCHVMDVADGHVRALERLDVGSDGVFEAYNLGRGAGASVLELVRMFEAVSGKSFPYVFADRRPGDAASYYCSAEKAERELGWKAVRSLESAIESGIRFAERA